MRIENLLLLAFVIGILAAIFVGEMVMTRSAVRRVTMVFLVLLCFVVVGAMMIYAP